MTPLETLIQANFVETNLRQDELLKRMIDIERILGTVVAKLIPPTEESDDSEVVYPDEDKISQQHNEDQK